jgi:hypothetical protein
VPNKSNRKQPFGFDKKSYKQRHRIENAFCRLKEFRRTATGYDRLARNFLASVCLVAAIVWWILCASPQLMRRRKRPVRKRTLLFGSHSDAFSYRKAGQRIWWENVAALGGLLDLTVMDLGRMSHTLRWSVPAERLFARGYKRHSHRAPNLTLGAYRGMASKMKQDCDFSAKKYGTYRGLRCSTCGNFRKISGAERYLWWKQHWCRRANNCRFGLDLGGLYRWMVVRRPIRFRHHSCSSSSV